MTTLHGLLAVYVFCALLAAAHVARDFGRERLWSPFHAVPLATVCFFAGLCWPILVAWEAVDWISGRGGHER